MMALSSPLKIHTKLRATPQRSNAVLTVNLIDPATGKRPLSGFGSFGLKSNDGNNSFSALQASVERRFVNGLLFQMNYMWSHGITDSSIGAGESVSFQNQSCRACDHSDTSQTLRGDRLNMPHTAPTTSGPVSVRFVPCGRGSAGALSHPSG